MACCGSRRWLALMNAQWPPASIEQAAAASEQAFDQLRRADWLQAFAAHSPIGAPRGGDTVGGAEQSAVTNAEQALLDQLLVLGGEYERRFGFVFLIRARGRSAAELLAALRERLEHPPELEFAIACTQQREITRLRLEALA
jgi:2-oxo-4-hydroxy-4-carboxy-5-ureidoimidazoline decarboxylase